MTDSLTHPVHPGQSPAVVLPRWYARLGPEGPDGPSGAPGVLLAGRLQLFDPEQGCDVMTFGRNGRSVAVFDGYLFDRDALAAELGRPGSSAAPALLAVAYERWGERLFERFDGSYLAAIWDDEAETLLLGHDALGRHPAFYSAGGDGFWFGSNILALAGSGRVSNRPNRVSLAMGMLLFWPEAGETHFEAIRRVRPGHYLKVGAGPSLSETCYWTPIPDDDEPWLPHDEVHERFEPELQKAVERRMALGPQGIMLSGGVDSVTVAALAARCTAERGSAPLTAVSGRTGYELTGEERMQSRVAEALGMPRVVSTTLEWLNGRDPIQASLDICAELPSPTRIWWVGTYTRFYRRTADQGLHVLLTGAGGDNWLGVADAHAADLMRRFRPIELARFVRADIGTGGASFVSAARRLLWAGGVVPLVNSTWALLAPDHKLRYHSRKWSERLPRWLCPDPALRRELIERLVGRRTPDRDASGARPRNYYRHSLRTADSPYLHFENETGHHIQHWCGLRLLSPYHDHRLVGFFNRISPEVLLHGGRYKGLLRPVVARHFPGLGLERQRKDYPKEHQQRKLAELRQSLSRAARASTYEELSRVGVLDAAAFVHEVRASPQMEFTGLARVFTALSAEQWLPRRTSG